MSDPSREIIEADCVEWMRAQPAASFTAVVTDPPYSLGFMGKAWDKDGIAFRPEVWREVSRLMNPGGVLLAFGGTRTFHRLACAIEDAGFDIRDCLCWLQGQGFPKSLDLSKAIDRLNGATREATREATPGAVISWDNRSMIERARYDEPATKESHRWLGYGTCLKPAWEPIVLAMKPLSGTFAENALKHGVAGINIDASRITMGDPYSYPNGPLGNLAPTSLGRRKDGSSSLRREEPVSSHPLGRWPPNLALDEDVAKMLDERVGNLPPGFSGKGGGFRTELVGGELKDTELAQRDWGGYGDSGGASRFFYTAKASPSDRNWGLGRKGLRSIHPTVKPVSLMRWLVRLVKMPSGTRILDPFAGSGSTGVACAIEGIDFVGVEREPEYAAVARERIKYEHEEGPTLWEEVR